MQRTNELRLEKFKIHDVITSCRLKMVAHLLYGRRCSRTRKNRRNRNERKIFEICRKP